jgi:hypothetical protein
MLGNLSFTKMGVLRINAVSGRVRASVTRALSHRHALTDINPRSLGAGLIDL